MMCGLPYFKHKWRDVPIELLEGIYLLFARPIGIAKAQYCERCGLLRVSGLNLKEVVQRYDAVAEAKRILEYKG